MTHLSRSGRASLLGVMLVWIGVLLLGLAIGLILMFVAGAHAVTHM